MSRAGYIVKRCDARLPPGVAARAGWVAVASTKATTAARVATRSWRSVAAAGSAAVTTSVAALRSTTPLTATTETTTAAHTTNVTGSSVATTTAASTSTTASTEAGAFAGNGLEESRDFLVGLLQQVKEIAYDSAVAAVEESSGNTSVSSTSSTTDTVNVIVNIGGQVIVDDVGDCRFENKKSVYVSHAFRIGRTYHSGYQDLGQLQQ